MVLGMFYPILEPSLPICSLELLQDDVREAFRRVGDIKVQLIKDRDTGESRGFGFITFSDASKAEEACGLAG